MTTIEILVLGSGGVGKTTLISRFTRARVIAEDRINGHGRILYEMFLGTSSGPFRFRIQEISGIFRIDGTVGQCVMLVFDTKALSSIAHFPSWLRDANHNDMPVVVLGNKRDLPGRFRPSLGFIRKNREMYYDGSALSNFHVVEPLLWLATQVTGIAGLEFQPVPELRPAEIYISPRQREQFAAELLAAREAPAAQGDEGEDL